MVLRPRPRKRTVALTGMRDEPRQQLGEGQRACWHSETQGPQAVVPKPRGQAWGQGKGVAMRVATWVLTLMCRCFRKYCSRQALRPSARTRSWPLGDLIHGLRCWGRGGLHIGALPTATLLGVGASVPGQSKPPVQCTLPRHSVLLAWLTATATQSKSGIQRDRVFLGVGRSCPSPLRCCKGRKPCRRPPQASLPLRWPQKVRSACLGHLRVSPSRHHVMEGRGEPARGPHLGRGPHPSAYLPRQEGVPPPLTDRLPPLA